MNVKIEGIELDKVNPGNYGGMCSRTFVVKAETQEDGGFETIATTSAPALVVDWTRWEIVREILPMKYCQKPDNDKAPVLDSHMRYSVDDILGYAKNWRTNENDLLCKVFISETEQDVKTKIIDGTLDSVSLGYMTDTNQTVEIPKKAEVIIDGVTYKNEYEDDYPLLVRTWWKCKEVSIVAIGADDAAKIKRALQSGIKADDPELQKLLNEILTSQKALDQKINSIKITGGNMPEIPEKIEKTSEQIKLDLINEIDKTAEGYGDAGVKKAAEFRKRIRETEAMTEGQSTVMVKEFYKSVTDEIIQKGSSSQPIGFMDLTEKDKRDFSVTRAVQNLLKGNRSGIEFEISQDLEKRTGEGCGVKEILLPTDYRNVGLREAYPQLIKRAHSLGTDSEGGYFKNIDFRGDMLKGVIRNETVLGRLGATVMTGMKGQLKMPKIVSGLSMYNTAENTAGTASYMVIGLDTVEGKRISGNTKIGRQQIENTDPTLPGFAEMLIRDLYDSANVKTDYDGINGTGAGNNPRGILNQTGPASASLSTVNWKNLINFKRLIAKANGKKENMKWGYSVDVESVLDVTPKVAGQAFMLRSEDGTVTGYAGESSNQIPDQVAIQGFWPEFFIIFFGTEKLIVADQPSHTSDEIEISLHRYGNFHLRSSESFAIADDATIDIWNS